MTVLAGAAADGAGAATGADAMAAGGAVAAIFAAGTNIAPVLVPSLAAKAESPSPSNLLPPAS